MRIVIALVATVALAVACGATPASTAPATGAPTAPSLPGFASAAANVEASGGLAITVTEVTYGALAAKTTDGAICSAALAIGGGYYGDQPASTLPQTVASATGVVRWTYPAPRVPARASAYSLTCTSGTTTGTAKGTFDIPDVPMKATSLRVRVTVDAPPHATVDPDPSLVPLRDAVVAKMKATLPTEWKNATRGLGVLALDETSADIPIYVVAAKGTSVHRLWETDGSEDIIVYVSDRFGPQTVENAVATSLHELGHIWCCYGPDTFPAGTVEQGHWLVKLRDPGLYGVDKYGLMTDPVTCVSFGAVISCPNRFSDREMAALGFATFPPPAVDPCVAQALSLNSSLTALRAQLDSQEATLTSLDTQIKAIKAQYPNGNYPPSVATKLNSLVDQYNPLVAPYNQGLTTYNTQVKQLNGLPCDAS